MSQGRAADVQAREVFLRHLGRNLADARHHAGLTQDRVAERAGIDTRVVRYVEAGDRDPGAYTLARLAVAVGADLDALVPNIA